MRTGSNPEKASKKIALKTNHRVILVVFIPDLIGYYENSLEVFKLCLNSLIIQNKGEYTITVVNNGSCQEVKNIISNYSQEEIDSIIHHSINIGKIDALIGAARGAREELITLTDSDILFVKNWDSATRDIFSNFKKAGSVSPIPFRHGLFYGTSSVLKEILLKRVQFTFKEIPDNFDDQNKYLSSINWNNEKNEKVKWPVIEKDGNEAIVGSGHQVITIKRELLFKTVPVVPSLTLVGGNSEYKYVDEPIDKAGLMRLSTYNNYAYHMGNHVEAWMKNMHKKFDDDIELKFKPYKDRNKSSQLFFKLSNKNYTIKKHILKLFFKLFYKYQ